MMIPTSSVATSSQQNMYDIKKAMAHSQYVKDMNENHSPIPFNSTANGHLHNRPTNGTGGTTPHSINGTGAHDIKANCTYETTAFCPRNHV